MKTVVEFFKDYTDPVRNTTFKAGQWYDGEKDSALDKLIADGVCREISSEEIRAKHENKPLILRSIPTAAEVEQNRKEMRTMLKAELDEAMKGQRRPGMPLEEETFAKTGGYDSFSQFLVDVQKEKQGVSPRLRKWNEFVQNKISGMSETVSADGGFLVPTEFRAQLLMGALEGSLLAKRARNIPVGSNSVKIPAVNETTHASGSTFGGVVLYRPDEGVAKTASYPQFHHVTLTMHKLVGLCYVTDELLEDSAITLGPLLGNMFSQAIQFQVDEDFVNGTGANQPLGVMAAPCLVSVAKETGQAATTIQLKNITKMWSRLKPRSKANAIWICNPDCFQQLAELSVTVGTGGSAVGFLNPNTSGATGAPPMSLMGRPVYETEHCQTLGTTGDIILGDWSQYLFATKGGVKADTSIHLKFDYDETAFRFVFRFDGQPWETSALTPAHGSNTLSSFVALATRS